MGAIIGVILGGEKGAAIGAVIGAGAGTGVQAMSKAAQVQLPAKSMLSFRLETPLTVTPSSTLLKSAERRLGTVRHGVRWMNWLTSLNMDPLQLRIINHPDKTSTATCPDAQNLQGRLTIPPTVALISDVKAGLTDLLATVESLVTKDRRTELAGLRANGIRRLFAESRSHQGVWLFPRHTSWRKNDDHKPIGVEAAGVEPFRVIENRQLAEEPTR